LSKAVEIARTPTTVSRYLRGLVETGRHADALEALEGELPEGLGDFPELIKASALAGTDQSDQAEEIFRGILAKVPPQRTPLVIGMVTAGFGREQGLKRLVRWIDLRPKDSFYIQQVASLVGTTEGKGSWEKSAQLYGRAVGLAKKQSALRAQALTGLGVAEYNLKNYKKARDAYLQALDIRANDIQALNNLAYLYVDGLDDAKKGLTYAKQAIEYQPRNPNVLDTYGWALAKVGRLSDAEKALEQAVRQSRTPVALYHLGWVYEQSGRLTDGLRFYRDALVLLQEGTGDPSLKPRLNEAIERVEKKRADKRSSS
jgi:tetratricopeptide (TPR) repeat protein